MFHKKYLFDQAGPNFMDLYIKVAWNLNETCVCLQSCVYIGSRDSDGPIKTTLENFRNLSIQNWELRFLICCWDSKVRSGLGKGSKKTKKLSTWFMDKPFIQRACDSSFSYFPLLLNNMLYFFCPSEFCSIWNLVQIKFFEIFYLKGS